MIGEIPMLFSPGIFERWPGFLDRKISPKLSVDDEVIGCGHGSVESADAEESISMRKRVLTPSNSTIFVSRLLPIHNSSQVPPFIRWHSILRISNILRGNLVTS